MLMGTSIGLLFSVVLVLCEGKLEDKSYTYGPN